MRYRQKRLVEDGQEGRRGGSAWTRRLRLITCALLVLVGLAGAASAAVLIGSKQVKDGSLTGHDLRLGTVRGSDVRDQSLQPQDFDIVPQGPTGAQGVQGDPGVNGSRGVNVSEVTITVFGISTTPVEVPCTPPQKAISGSTSLPGLVEMLQSAPAIDGSSWGFRLRNRGVNNESVTLQAFCVTDR